VQVGPEQKRDQHLANLQNISSWRRAKILDGNASHPFGPAMLAMAE